MTAASLFPFAAFGAAGAALGAVYFLLLHRMVRCVAAGGPVLNSVALSLLRYALAAAVFWWIVQMGAAALIASLAGFSLVRIAAARIVGSA